MENFNWLLRTKLIVRIINILIVKIFHWHSIWRGSISDALFKVLNVANGKSPWFLLPLPLTCNLRAFAVAVSSAWNALPLLFARLAFSHYWNPLECHFHREVFSESPLKVLTLPCLVLFHHVALFYFLCSDTSLSEVFMIWVTLLACIFRGGSGCVPPLLLDPCVPRPTTDPGTQWQSINTYWATDWLTDWMNNSKSFTWELP